MPVQISTKNRKRGEAAAGFVDFSRDQNELGFPAATGPSDCREQDSGWLQRTLSLGKTALPVRTN